jgi:hypothetical protein
MGWGWERGRSGLGFVRWAWPVGFSYSVFGSLLLVTCLASRMQAAGSQAHAMQASMFGYAQLQSQETRSCCLVGQISELWHTTTSHERRQHTPVWARLRGNTIHFCFPRARPRGRSLHRACPDARRRHPNIC